MISISWKDEEGKWQLFDVKDLIAKDKKLAHRLFQGRSVVCEVTYDEKRYFLVGTKALLDTYRKRGASVMLFSEMADDHIGEGDVQDPHNDFAPKAFPKSKRKHAPDERSAPVNRKEVVVKGVTAARVEEPLKSPDIEPDEFLSGEDDFVWV